jgi:hypothetical protein
MSKDRTALKRYRYFDVFLTNPRSSPQGSSAEIQIYQCDITDGSVSEFITASAPRAGIIDRRPLHCSVNSASGDQLFRVIDFHSSH